MAKRIENSDRPKSELTKREHFAIMALQSLLIGYQETAYKFGHAELVSIAVASADELLEKLEK